MVTTVHSTTATQASHVIPAGYPITQGTLATVKNSAGVLSNYKLSFTNGKLTVTKAPLSEAFLSLLCDPEDMHAAA